MLLKFAMQLLADNFSCQFNLFVLRIREVTL